MSKNNIVFRICYIRFLLSSKMVLIDKKVLRIQIGKILFNQFAD